MKGAHGGSLSLYLDMDKLVSTIEREFSNLASAEALAATRKFVPTSTQVYGLRMPQLNEMAKKYKDGSIPLSLALWETGSFEGRMLAVKLLEKLGRNEASEILKVMDLFKDNLSDWAICDTLGMQGARKALKYYPRDCFDLARRYILNNNPWVIRLGIVLLIHFTKSSEYRDQIPGIVAHLRQSKDHYLKKALVWLDKNLEKNLTSS